MWQSYLTQLFPEGCQVTLAVTEVMLAYGSAVCMALAMMSELRATLSPWTHDC